MRVLALTKYGSGAASTRQRFELYESALGRHGITVEYAPLFDNDHLERLVAGKRASPLAVSRAYSRRLLQLVGARRFDLLWIYCELFPYFPGIFERLATLWQTPFVFDYDDAIFHMYDAAPNRLVRGLLSRKLEVLLKRATACCCGNAYLHSYAVQFSNNSIVLPTVVDTQIYRPVPKTEGVRPLVIGWIGSPSTWCNVRPLLSLLRDLHGETGVRVRVIGAGKETHAGDFHGLESIDWSEQTEVAEVQTMDIGIMPLLDRPFQRGKSGYKLVQYMACGIPVVASPVGVNSTIVEDGVSGLLASDPEQWRASLTRLINDAELRAAMGRAGRIRAVEAYSLEAHAPRLIEVMRDSMKRSRTRSG